MVTEWSVFGGSGEEWDQRLMSLPSPSVHQGHRWGEHRRRFGWVPLRFVASQDGHTVAMVQANVRTYLGRISVVWVPGGPVGELTECGTDLRKAIAAAIGTRNLVVRINPDRVLSEQDVQSLVAAGWGKSRRTLLSGSTMHYRLDVPEPNRLDLLTRNWRHNLRRGQKRGFRVEQWVNPSPEKIETVYGEMHEYKGLDHLSGSTTREWIASIIDAYGDDCIIVRCEDSDGTLLAVRGALLLGDRAWDTFAAATPAGRKGYASYVAFWKLMELCALRGVKTYDMGGIDPIGNRGVFDFKQGTGADLVTLLGEWEHAHPKLLGSLVSRRIARNG